MMGKSSHGRLKGWRKCWTKWGQQIMMLICYICDFMMLYLWFYSLSRSLSLCIKHSAEGKPCYCEEFKCTWQINIQERYYNILCICFCSCIVHFLHSNISNLFTVCILSYKVYCAPSNRAMAILNKISIFSLSLSLSLSWTDLFESHIWQKIILLYTCFCPFVGTLWNCINQLLIHIISVCGIVMLICVCSIARTGCYISPNGPKATILEY